jgi:hypothetical protein
MVLSKAISAFRCLTVADIGASITGNVLETFDARSETICIDAPSALGENRRIPSIPVVPSVVVQGNRPNFFSLSLGASANLRSPRTARVLQVPVFIS